MNIAEGYDEHEKKQRTLKQKVQGGGRAMKLEFISTRKAMPPYGKPVLIQVRGVVQDITYVRDSGDEAADWFEPVYFEHDDTMKIGSKNVEFFALLPDRISEGEQ